MKKLPVVPRAIQAKKWSKREIRLPVRELTFLSRSAKAKIAPAQRISAERKIPSER
jgi:hypothetical protein